MEKAILKTLIYASIFDYPLKKYEIHKWLISYKANLRQVEKALQRLIKKGKIKTKSEYYFLPGKQGIVLKRIKREQQSKNFFWKAKYTSLLLKLIPTIKLIGISGGLSMNNAEKSDDIDLFLIVDKGSVWISRILVIFFLNALGIRRKANMKNQEVSGKICTNILVEEDKLEQTNKDLFIAHEVLQMKVLWHRQGIYQRYLLDNSWVFEFLPNWIGQSDIHGNRLQFRQLRIDKGGKKKLRNYKIFDYSMSLLEVLSKKIQLKIMQKSVGMERIEDGSLYFHPKDIRQEVLKDYKLRINNLI